MCSHGPNTCTKPFQIEAIGDTISDDTALGDVNTVLNINVCNHNGVLFYKFKICVVRRQS